MWDLYLGVAFSPLELDPPYGSCDMGVGSFFLVLDLFFERVGSYLFVICCGIGSSVSMLRSRIVLDSSYGSFAVVLDLLFLYWGLFLVLDLVYGSYLWCLIFYLGVKYSCIVLGQANCVGSSILAWIFYFGVGSSFNV